MFRPQNYDYFCSWQSCFRSGWQYRLRHKAQFFSMRAVLATRFSKNACGNGLPVSNDRRNIPVYLHPESFILLQKHFRCENLADLGACMVQSVFPDIRIGLYGSRRVADFLPECLPE